MKNVIYVLLAILVVVGITRAVYEYQLHKEELAAHARFMERQKDVDFKGGPKVQMVEDTTQLAKEFYPNLASCTPVNVSTEDNTNYVVYGRDGNKCSFEKFSISYRLECKVPMDVAKKYAISGESNPVFMNDVNNDPKYCKIVYAGDMKKTEKEIQKNAAKKAEKTGETKK